MPPCLRDAPGHVGPSHEAKRRYGSTWAHGGAIPGSSPGAGLPEGRSHEEILRLYPYLENDDIREALSYAAWRVEEIEVPLAVA